MKNSFVNISEVNRQCLNSLRLALEDDFEKVPSTISNALFIVGVLTFLNNVMFERCDVSKFLTMRFLGDVLKKH